MDDIDKVKAALLAVKQNAFCWRNWLADGEYTVNESTAAGSATIGRGFTELGAWRRALRNLGIPDPSEKPSEPEFCPFCGGTNVYFSNTWTARSGEPTDPENSCEQDEYQCRDCEGRSFWT